MAYIVIPMSTYHRYKLMDIPLPVLYSFRRCPYAIRARMAIVYSNITVELREVCLQEKPIALFKASEKATVPVLQLTPNHVLDESLDIMIWALNRSDPDALRATSDESFRLNALIIENDNSFKLHLDHYKYADRFPQHDAEYYRQQAEYFIYKLDSILQQRAFLMGNKLSLVDFAIFPFIRQFSLVDSSWFDQSKHKHLRTWLNNFLCSAIFGIVMKKHDTWRYGDDVIVFPSPSHINTLEH